MARATGARSAAVTERTTSGPTLVHGGPAALTAAAASCNCPSRVDAADRNAARSSTALGLLVVGVTVEVVVAWPVVVGAEPVGNGSCEPGVVFRSPRNITTK